jgi:hypothetical protein
VVLSANLPVHQQRLPFAPTQLLWQIFPWINVHHELLDAIVRALQEVPAVELDVKVGKLGVSWDHRWHLN